MAEKPMTSLLEEPRISYASRKVRRLREDIEAWKAEYAQRGDRSAWEDLIRDTNRLAQDLFALDRRFIEKYASPSFPAVARLEPRHPLANEMAEWASIASGILDTATTLGKDGGEVEALNVLRGHLETAKTIGTQDLIEPLFRELARVWKADTMYLSSTSAMTNHWAYQRIIRLGPPVVPLLLRELRQKPDFWFDALRTITGQNPITPEIRGKVSAMAEAWVKWGEANRLI
jgi:hypothetical protein